MILSQLLRQAQVDPAASFGDADVTGAQLDSRKCGPGTLFFCMPGTRTDSQSYLPAALAAGASAAVVYSAEGLEAARGIGLPAVQLADVREAAWRICDALFQHPTRAMRVVGITGTNGKTTTAWIIRDALRALGISAGYLGTLGFELPSGSRELPNTTPFAVELYNLLAEARDQGIQALAMEISSHALAERRADGVELDVAVFTNLTQDHLDFHGSMEAYADAKWRLFSELPDQTDKTTIAAINVGDPVGAQWRDRLPSNTIAYGIEVPAVGPSLGVRPVEVRVDGARLAMTFTSAEGPTVEQEVCSRLGGTYNVENAAAAAAALWALHLTPEEIAEGLEAARPVPGRFESVPNERGIGILVDYAHTPDALEKLLLAVRPLTTGKVITVFGCGGDRDRGKRPQMARSASLNSDFTVLTSDNPRTEDPRVILSDAAAGIVHGHDHVQIEDRREAVAFAVRRAAPGDVVVIAGKGHENYQIIGRIKHPMDDRELTREALV